MITKIHDGVWKVKADSNVYFLEKEMTVIDTAQRKDRQIIIQLLSKVVDFKDIRNVIFTHMNHDHIGNFDLFPNAKFYASQWEIEDFNRDPFGTVLDKDTLKKFQEAISSGKVVLHDVYEIKKIFTKIIPTPGHTRGSIALLYKKDILFSGDTLFKTCIGRTDLPTSVPEKMQETLNELVKYNHKILCPGHDY